MEKFLEKWQQLMGAVIGAITPFLLWWIVETYQQRKKYYDDLYVLEKELVNQINSTLDIKKSIIDFINKQLNILIGNIEENPDFAFSVDCTYFPLFSVSSFGEQINHVNTKSGYIENKLAKVSQMSKDMPCIIKDLKRQFDDLINLNRELVLNKSNSPEVQKKIYLNNIIKYKEFLEHDVLGKNIPIYLKILIQTRTALLKLKKIGLIRWQMRFDGSFCFYFNKKVYNKDREKDYDVIEKYFEDEVAEILNKIKNS